MVDLPWSTQCLGFKVLPPALGFKNILVLLPYLAAKKLAQEGRIVYRYRIEGEVVRFR